MEKRVREKLKEARALGVKCDGCGPPSRAWISWLGGMTLAALGLIGAVCVLEPPRFYAEARIQTGPRASGMVGLRAAAASLNSREAFAGAAGHAQLLLSRDLARRVIKELAIDETPEFNPGAQGLGLASRTLVLLGMKRDPARQSPGDWVLETFQERLRITGPDPGGLVSIGVQSENPELAANVANRLAELYTQMRADVQKAPPRQALARIIAFAATPRAPVRNNGAMLLRGAAVAAAFGACAALILRRLPMRKRFDEPVAQPYPLAGRRTIARVRLRQRLSPPLAVPPDLPPCAAAATGGEDRPEGDLRLVVHALTRITAQRAYARRGIRVLVAEPMPGDAGLCWLSGLARKLAQEGQTIVVFPEGVSFENFGPPGAAPGFEAGTSKGARPGDLVTGAVSFTDIIRRDPASRLHLLQIAQSGEAEPQDLEVIIDALAATYDYVVVTLAPDIAESPIGKMLIQTSDFALIRGPANAASAADPARKRLIESCVGEVLLFGAGTEFEASLTQSAACL